jgi:hypothetical protein
MALSKNLHNALIEFVGSLKEDDPNAPYAEKAVTKLRHAETDGVGVYEDVAFQVLEGLFDLQRQNDPNAPSEHRAVGLTDGGSGSEGMSTS